PSAAGDPLQALVQLNDQAARGLPANAEQLAAIESQYAQFAGAVLVNLQAAGAASIGNAAAPTAFSALKEFEPQYLLADGDKLGFVLLRLAADPADAPACAAAIARLREMIKHAQQKHQHVWIGLTGMPVIEHDEMAASQFDMLWTS